MLTCCYEFHPCYETWDHICRVTVQKVYTHVMNSWLNTPVYNLHEASVTGKVCHMLVTIKDSLWDQVDHGLIQYGDILFKFYLDSYNWNGDFFTRQISMLGIF